MKTIRWILQNTLQRIDHLHNRSTAASVAYLAFLKVRRIFFQIVFIFKHFFIAYNYLFSTNSTSFHLDKRKSSALHSPAGPMVTVEPSKTLTLLWGATGEQEWTPALTTGKRSMSDLPENENITNFFFLLNVFLLTILDFRKKQSKSTWITTNNKRLILEMIFRFLCETLRMW